MMNFNYQSSLVKKIILILMVALGLLGMALFVYRRNRPAAPTLPLQSLPQPSVESEIKQPGVTYTFSGQYPTFPQSLPVFKTSSPSVLTQDLAQTLAHKFGLTVSPQLFSDQKFGQTYVYTQDQTSLTLYSTPLIIRYENYQTASRVKLTETELQTRAEEFIKSKELLPASFTLTLTKTVFLKLEAVDMLPVTSLDKSSVINFQYDYQLNHYSIFSHNYTKAPLNMLINLDGSVRKMEIASLPQTMQSLGEGALRPAQEAFEGLKKDQGAITYLLSPEDEYTQVSFDYQIQTADLSKIDLAYYYAAAQSLFQPMYVFTGQAKDVSSKILKIKVVTPALETKLFIP